MMVRLALPVILAAGTMLGGCYVEEDQMMVVRSAPPPEAAEVVAV
jgi:hypothetical protein